jgi:hypothetical protein
MGSVSHPPCLVDGLAPRPDLYRQVGAQPTVVSQAIIVMLKVFDHGLEVAHPRPQASALQKETIVDVNPLTQ